MPDDYSTFDFNTPPAQPASEQTKPNDYATFDFSVTPKPPQQTKPDDYASFDFSVTPKPKPTAIVKSQAQVPAQSEKQPPGPLFTGANLPGVNVNRDVFGLPIFPLSGKVGGQAPKTIPGKLLSLFPDRDQAIAGQTSKLLVPGAQPKLSPIEEGMRDISSLFSGYVKGRTGLPTSLTTGDPMIDAIYARLSPEDKARWDKNIGPPNKLNIHENRTLAQVGEWIGWVQGAGQLSSLARGAIKKFVTKKVGTGIETGISKLPPSIFYPVMGTRESMKLLTPIALGVGGQTALTESLNQIFDHGYLDPKQIGEDVAINAGTVYAFPAAGVLFAKGLGKAASLAPELLRYVPPALGGITGAPREAITQAVQRIRPLMAPVNLWSYAAQQLKNTYNLAGKILQVKALQDHFSELNTMGKTMDGLLRISSKQAFPSYLFRGAGGFPEDSPLKPQIILQALDQPILQVKIPSEIEGAKPEFLQLGGGISGRITHNVFADQMDNIYQEMKNSTSPIDKANAWHALRVASKLRKFAGQMGPIRYKSVANSIESLLKSERFTTTYHNVQNKLDIAPTDEGHFLILIKDLFREASYSGSAVQEISRLGRTLTSHLLLGMFNFASGITVLNRLAFPLATEGPELVAKGLNEAFDNTELYQRFVRILGIEHPSTSLTEGMQSRLAKSSFTFYNKAERYMLPTTAIARFYKLRGQGVPYAQAVNQAVDFARQLRTSMTYDIPQIIRAGGGRLGAVMKMGFQFFPFAFKSLQFASQLGLEDFSNYIGYMFMMAGIKGVPFATAIDRSIALYTGHSILNSALANPQMQQILTGIPGVSFGVDLGSRHNWTQSLVDRVMGMQAAPFANWSANLINAYGQLLSAPNGANFIRAFKVSLPLGMEQLVNALDDEKHGAILDARGFPVVKQPTRQELGLKALGFSPIRETGERALQNAIYIAKTRQTQIKGSYEDNYRRALQSGDSKEIGDAARLARQHGVSAATLSGIRKDLRMSPSRRLFKRTPKTLREQFKWLVGEQTGINR